MEEKPVSPVDPVAVQVESDSTEALLREVNHRVSNNLQIISSLLMLQASSAEDYMVQRQLESARHRVYSISAIYDLVRQSGTGRLGIQTYAQHLLADQARAHRVEGRVAATVEGDEVLLEAGRAVYIGLILNELIANACEHAFPRRRRGHLRVQVIREPEVVALTVSDDGTGMPEGLDFANARSFGMKLVRNLSVQLGAQLQMQSGKGTSVTLRIPVERT